MPLRIYDGNWVVRKAYEVDPTGFAMRTLFENAFHGIDPQIWVFDGKNAKQARRTVYPGYKAKRKPGSDEFYKTMDVFKGLIAMTNKIKIEVTGYEGDDVIAALVRQAPGVEMILHANDGDYHVLCNDKVTMTHPALPEVPNEEVQLYKSLVGDTSDDIPGLARFGEGGGPRGGGYHDLTPEQKATWVAWFKANLYDAVKMEPTHLPSKEELGLSPSLHKTFENSWKELTAFWLIVGFVPMSNELLTANMVVGKPDWAGANTILRGIMQ